MSTPSTTTTRPQHDPVRIAPEALGKMISFHTDVIETVSRAIANNPVVVVGMAQNPHVKNVKKALTDASIPFTYLEYGSYLSEWRPRLAIKLWSGWPTFPQVFVKGVLIGGEDLTKAEIASGALKKRLDAA